MSSYLVNMEIAQVYGFQYAIPVGVVLILALFVFLFGFNKIEEPDFVQLSKKGSEDKKSKRRRKEKETKQKTQPNGIIDSSKSVTTLASKEDKKVVASKVEKLQTGNKEKKVDKKSDVKEVKSMKEKKNLKEENKENIKIKPTEIKVVDKIEKVTKEVRSTSAKIDKKAPLNTKDNKKAPLSNKEDVKIPLNSKEDKKVPLSNKEDKKAPVSSKEDKKAPLSSKENKAQMNKKPVDKHIDHKTAVVKTIVKLPETKKSGKQDGEKVKKSVSNENKDALVSGKSKKVEKDASLKPSQANIPTVTDDKNKENIARDDWVQVSKKKKKESPVREVEEKAPKKAKSSESAKSKDHVTKLDHVLELVKNLEAEGIAIKCPEFETEVQVFLDEQKKSKGKGVTEENPVSACKSADDGAGEANANKTKSKKKNKKPAVVTEKELPENKIDIQIQELPNRNSNAETQNEVSKSSKTKPSADHSIAVADSLVKNTTEAAKENVAFDELGDTWQESKVQKKRKKLRRDQ